MSIASGIESLGGSLDRLRRDGQQAAADVVQHMRTVEQQAKEASLDQLARLCRVGAETIAALAADAAGFAGQHKAVLEHVEQVVQFAGKCVAAAANGADLAGIVPPALFTVPDAEEEKHFAETVGMFVGHAIGAIAELEEEILSLENSDKPDETVSGIRRTVHTLKAEFGVLNMTGPQTLCHQTETAIDACSENKQPFPVDVMLQVVDLLKQFLDRLTRDVKAPFGDCEPMLRKLRSLIETATASATEAKDDSRVQMAVSGEFADSLTEFITEARAHLSDAESAMVAFSSQPDNLENINLTFRAFHTIKGVAGFLNLTPLVELAHVTETLLDGARSQRLVFSQEDIDLVLASGDMITQMIQSLEGQAGPMARDWRRLVRSCQMAATRSGAATASTTPAATPAAAVVTAAPAAAAAPAKPAEPEVDKVVPVPAPAAVVRPERPTAAPAAATAAKPAPAAAEHAEGDHKAARVERTIKVSTTRLDMLVDMVGELVIAQSMVLQDPAIQRLDSQSLTRNIGQVGKITRDLQEAAMSLRMVTVKATFQKMARLVRDVAGKAGKKVELTITGEETELDRNVVEQISDPLVHMIRNAIDHGIEAPDDRRQKGKRAEGSLTLSAYHQGGSIVIEIKDDGKGLDKVRIGKKAIEKGLMPPDTDPSALSDNEAFGLIFLPGFSTAEKVTDLSGRGVGMDVVRRNIEALRGKIEIESKVGVGTTFRMRLPLTLAIIDGMVVRVGNERYVVPTLSIEQSFRPAANDLHYLVDRGECVHVRGAVLPVHRLKQIFGQGSGLDDIAQGILIVVEVDGQRSCLFVDEILGQQQVVIKSLGLSRDRVAGLSGGAIMTDGRVALILDVGTLVESAMSV
ncbi:MAG: chemotaxis protein CheA [Planctomycetes bacterium]|nr:chemotaxis protein CheA [Planctomycetota bacterium]